MGLDIRKINFVQEFLRIQNEEIIEGLEKLLRKKKNELIDKDLSPISLKQYQHEIDQAVDDSINGRIIKANDLKAKYNK